MDYITYSQLLRQALLPFDNTTRTNSRSTISISVNRSNFNLYNDFNSRVLQTIKQ